jgi:hypothetical protein
VIAGGQPIDHPPPQAEPAQLDEFRALGMPDDQLALWDQAIAEAETLANEPITLTPDQMPAVEVFMASLTQWRWVGAGMGGVMRTGLDYPAVQCITRVLGFKWSAGLFKNIRIMEDAALVEWSRQLAERTKNQR